MSHPVTFKNLILKALTVLGVVAPDSVGIGSDYDGIESVPKGLEDVSKYPYLVRL